MHELCRKASYKLHALQRMMIYLSVGKARLLPSTFIDSQFDHASLIWIFAGKTIKKSVKFVIEPYK